MIWPLFAYRRRGRRIDPGPAIPITRNLSTPITRHAGSLRRPVVSRTASLAAANRGFHPLKQDLTPFDFCRRTAREDCLITSCEKLQFSKHADTRLQRDPSGSLHNTDTGRDRASDETASSVRSSPQRSSTTMSLPLLPWCGVRADRRSPMRIDSGVVEPFDFRCRRRPTTNFTRPRTRSSNPVPSSGESGELPYCAAGSSAVAPIPAIRRTSGTDGVGAAVMRNFGRTILQ